MIPKLEFTAESLQEEYRAQATETLDKEFTLNGSEDILCRPINTNCWLYAFKGYENHRAKLTTYGYASTEEAVEKFLQEYKDDPNNEYLVEISQISLIDMDYDNIYKNGTYIDENGKDTMMDYWDIEFDEEPFQEHEVHFIAFSVFTLIKK